MLSNARQFQHPLLLLNWGGVERKGKGRESEGKRANQFTERNNNNISPKGYKAAICTLCSEWRRLCQLYILTLNSFRSHTNALSLTPSLSHIQRWWWLKSEKEGEGGSWSRFNATRFSVSRLNGNNGNNGNNSSSSSTRFKGNSQLPSGSS